MTFETLGIGGKLNLLAMPRIRQAARDFSADVLHSHLSTRQLVVRLARTTRRPAVDRPRPRLHVRRSGTAGRAISSPAPQAVKHDLIEKGIPATASP